MHRADQIVPGMARRQFANPVLVTGEVIHFQGQLDDEPGVIAPRLFYFLHVFIHIARQHAPIVKIVAWHGAVFGKPDFPQTQFGRLRGILGRLSHGMAAERRVHVVIGGQRHSHRVRHGSPATAR